MDFFERMTLSKYLVLTLALPVIVAMFVMLTIWWLVNWRGLNPRELPMADPREVWLRRLKHRKG